MPPKPFRGGGRAGRPGERERTAAGPDALGEEDGSAVNERRMAEIAQRGELDAQMGFALFLSGPSRIGWMLNMQTTLVPDAEWPSGRSAVDYYFMCEDGSCFKAVLCYSPYFFVKCKSGSEHEVEEYLRRRFENTIESMQHQMKEDLELLNHLSGVRRSYLKLSFRNTTDLMTVRKALLPAAQRNGENYRDGVMALAEDFGDLATETASGMGKRKEHGALASIVGLREYDIPYHLRVAIDLDIRVGLWYMVSAHGPTTCIARLAEKDVRPDPIVLAFDIETSKMPLKFPDATKDHIMMISYMINGRGYLIVNRDIVSQDIEDFEYTPKPDFPGLFTIFNAADEQALLNRFFSHIQLVRPQIFVTYNGDFFDWPFIETRAAAYGMEMAKMIGIEKNSQGEYCASYCVHIDCFCWVKRDSYLPAGSHGLKAVCSIKLGYDPLELDPELMTPLASQDPQTLANYSVSDAVATYYLYMKYVHPFIFSLCNIIPLMPDEVLRKGTGTLCETLLMAQAYKAQVIMPNKHEEPREKFFKGHLLDSETYIGGHVEALEAGVYRSDFNYKFKIDPKTIDQLITDLERALRFFLEHESHVPFEQVQNFDAVHANIRAALEALRLTPSTTTKPLIYHLDVGSMYPNIILTNRLQPSAIVDEATCAVCDFNRPGKQCQRKMNWSWRGEFFSAKQNEYKMIMKQVESERFPSKHQSDSTVAFHELSIVEQTALVKKRLANYSQKVYSRAKKTETVQKTSIVCQRENSFYIDTVRSFRDRRYDYKNLQKVWKRHLDEATAQKDIPKIEESRKMIVVYDSLQLAHKCILNSFYGYVMRKAARWYSMEMGGIVCETGASIITLARQLIEQIGRPLELDTDGIWCMLPSGFPQFYTFELAGGKKASFAYPCIMLNHLLHDKFTNDQYQTIVDGAQKTYQISSENSIFFEIDGPYKAMVLPSSTEEGRQLKKRYAVFNEDGSLAELKGFEIKRRGELKLVKIFQSQIFKTFLAGTNLVECYESVATVANYWLDILQTRGQSMEDFELIELISENRSMSKALEDYGEQKSSSISTAKRLSEFLGEQMVKDKGLACKFIISVKPLGQPVTTRAIPVAIFSAPPEIRQYYLSKWLKDPALSTANIREIIDWQYYLERLGSMIQKLIVIPAAMQQVPNPVPRVAPPEWLKNQSSHGSCKMEQRKITDMFATIKSQSLDMEDIGGRALLVKRPAEPEEDKEAQLSGLAESLPPAIILETEKLVDPEQDYSAWIDSQRSYWRRLRSILKTAAQNKTRPSKRMTLSSMLDQDRGNILKSPWQIITIESTGTPGEFKVWALVGSQIKSIKMACPRRIFYSTREPMENGLGSSQVHYKLPDGRPAPFLYELKMSEKVFQEQFITNSAALLDPMLEGIWESSIPLDFQLLVSLGCVVSVDQAFQRPKELPTDLVFTPEQLNFRSTSEVAYLQEECIAFAFFAQISADSRHVMLLSFSNSPIIRTVVVDAGMRRQLTGVKSLMSQVIKGILGGVADQEPFFTNDQVQFEIDYFSDFDSAHRSLQRTINFYLDDRPHPTILLKLDSHSREKSVQIGALSRFPNVMVPTWLGDYVLPPLDWQRGAVRRIIEYYVQINGWLGERLSAARFAHIPIGNFAADWPVFVPDVFLSRMLKNSGYLLPWNEASLVSTSLSSKDLLAEGAIFTLPGNSSIDAPGLYTKVSVDLDVSSMPINAVLECSHINSDSDQTGPLFAILRTLVTNWLKESISSGSTHASHLVNGTFGWIRSGASRIVPPSILRTLRTTMDRAQEKLYEHVKKLGCTVVHGDHHRLLLATAKDHVENARAFVDYLLKDLKETDGLAWITLQPAVYWQTLLWMDCSNYAGILCAEDQQGHRTPVSVRLNIGEYLPLVLQRPFTILVAEYLTHLHNRPSVKANDKENAKKSRHFSLLAEEEEEDENGYEEPKDGNTGREENNNSEHTNDKNRKKAALKEPIPLEYSQKFLSIVREAQKVMLGSAVSEEDQRMREFPTRVGSHLARFANGPLQFVKFLGAVLSLDRRVAPEVFQLIKSGYALLGVREFSDEAVFTNPCRSFVLHDVVCENCNACRDIDFCRDIDVLAAIEDSVDSVPARGALCCLTCGNDYDLCALEGEIIEELQQDTVQYQQQDLTCLQCHSVKADQLSVLCSCSGRYRGETETSSLLDKVRVLDRISRALKFESLLLFISVNYPSMF